MPSSSMSVIFTFKIARKREHRLRKCLELRTTTYGDSVYEVFTKLVDFIALNLNARKSAADRQRFFTKRETPELFDGASTKGAW